MVAGGLGAADVAHLVTLAAILLLLVPVVGKPQSFIADEGAAMIQARSLAAGDGWMSRTPSRRSTRRAPGTRS